MFESFTSDARRSLMAAQDAARHRRHNFLGTEHLLLGVVAEDSRAEGSRTRPIVTAVGAAADAIVAATDQAIAALGVATVPDDQEVAQQVPFTPRAKRILELALAEALDQHVRFIGREHLLLAIAREGEGVGGQVLAKLGLTAGAIRDVVVTRARHGAFDINFTRGGQEAFALAWETADSENAELGSHHLLKALLAGDSVAARALAALNITEDALDDAIANTPTEGTWDETRRLRGLEFRPEREGIEIWVSDALFPPQINRREVHDKLQADITEAINNLAREATT
jgi:ATP-dependent Clp protease ATP-binding subunit ClpC